MTDQASDIIEIDGKYGYVWPFTSPFFGMSKKKCKSVQLSFLSTALYRGYQAHWLIADSKLYLKGIYAEASLKEHPDSAGSVPQKVDSQELIAYLFPSLPQPVFVDWFSGELDVGSVASGIRYHLKGHKKWLIEKGQVVSRGSFSGADEVPSIMSMFSLFPEDLQQTNPEAMAAEEQRQKRAEVRRQKRLKKEARQQYDIIGDIHGHADKLIAMLQKLGYRCESNGSRHRWHGPEDRQIIFVGDFIDRGPQQKQIMDIVMSLCDAGVAQAVMGNHEYNALAYHTKMQDRKGAPRYYGREHSAKNSNQHRAFLQAYENDPVELKKVLAFFKSLPLWLDLPGLRAVHACWDPAAVAVIKQYSDNEQSPKLTSKLLYQACQKGCAEYQAIETLLKGVEVNLVSEPFTDKDGLERNQARVKWWLDGPRPLCEMGLPESIFANGDYQQIINSDQYPGYAASEKPVFFGHYWFTGSPCIVSQNAACLDYSVANDGDLVAYRWQGESELVNEHFVAV